MFAQQEVIRQSADCLVLILEKDPVYYKRLVERSPHPPPAAVPLPQWGRPCRPGSVANMGRLRTAGEGSGESYFCGWDEKSMEDLERV